MDNLLVDDMTETVVKVDDSRPFSKAERRQAYEQARRSNAMEGLPPPCAYSDSLRERVIAGEISHVEAVDLLVAHYDETDG